MAVSLKLTASLYRNQCLVWTCPYPHVALKLLVALQQVFVEGDRVPVVIAEGSVEVCHGHAKLTWKLHERRHTKNHKDLKAWNNRNMARRDGSTTHPLKVSQSANDLRVRRIRWGLNPFYVMLCTSSKSETMSVGPVARLWGHWAWHCV